MKRSDVWFSPFQILKTLAQKKRRNVPLVRKLAYHLEKRLMNLNLETFCEILHSLSQLSFKSNVSIKNGNYFLCSHPLFDIFSL